MALSDRDYYKEKIKKLDMNERKRKKKNNWLVISLISLIIISMIATLFQF